MAYSGSTATTTAANPPRLVSMGALYGPAGSPTTGASNGTTGLSTAPAEPNAQGGALWTYVSTNKTTDMNIAGNSFFSDGDELGMRPGDVVCAVQFSSAGSSMVLSFHAVATVSTDGAGLSTGAIFTSTFRNS